MHENQAEFYGFAKIEIMGRQQHVGYVRTEAYGQVVMFRVDQPQIPAREYILEKPEYVDGKWTAAGAKVQRPAIEGCTVLIGAGSIYRIIPCSEAAALKAIESLQRAELKLIEPPPGAAAGLLGCSEMEPAGEPDDFEDDETLDDEDEENEEDSEGLDGEYKERASGTGI